MGSNLLFFFISRDIFCQVESFYTLDVPFTKKFQSRHLFAPYPLSIQIHSQIPPKIPNYTLLYLLFNTSRYIYQELSADCVIILYVIIFYLYFLNTSNILSHVKKNTIKLLDIQKKMIVRLFQMTRQSFNSKFILDTICRLKNGFVYFMAIMS